MSNKKKKLPLWIKERLKNTKTEDDIFILVNDIVNYYDYNETMRHPDVPTKFYFYNI